MLRRALLLSIALAGLLGCSNAWAGQTKLTVRGDVTAMALAGDAVTVVRRTTTDSFRLERLTPGAPAQTLLRLPSPEDDEPVMSLAGSAHALALGLRIGYAGGESHVYAGPPAGPLREVAACQAGLLLPAIAISGSRVAWASGGCGEPVDEPVAAGAATIVVGDANPAVAPRLVPLDAETLPSAIVLNGQSGLVGLVQPSFLSFFKSHVRRLGAGGLGETITRDDGGVVVPVGVLPNGDTVLSRGERDEEDSETCSAALFVLASGTTQRRPLSLGGCPTESDDLTLPAGSPRIGGDRVYAIVREAAPRGRGDEPPPEPSALRSARADGSAGRLLARGSYRPPLGLATDAAGRVAWWYRTCLGGSEIVIDDLAAPAARTAIPACTLKVLNRSARVRAGRITLRLRCPSGCAGQVYTKLGPVRSFAFKPGSHRLRVRLTPRERRSKRLRLRLEVSQGPPRTKVIRLR